jgi:hypothetical protein
MLLFLAAVSVGPIAAEDPKVLSLVDVDSTTRGFDRVVRYNAELQLSGRPWYDLVFQEPGKDSPYAFSAVWFEIGYQSVVPPLDGRRIPDGSRDWPNVWLGYDRLMFDYRLDRNESITVTVLIQDWVSWLPTRYDGLAIVDPAAKPQIELPQLYEEEIVLMPGTGTATIDLRRPLWCNNRKKGLSLDDVKAFGICLRRPAGTTTIGLNRFRLEGGRPDAGTFAYPHLVRCEKCGGGFSDRYAPFCPFCGTEMRDHLPISSGVPKFGDPVVVLPLIDAGGGGGNSGGGDDTSEKAAGSKGSQAVRHYDVYYNRAVGTPPVPERKRPQWEYRYQLKFGLGDELAAKPKIKRALLWLRSSLKIKEREEPVFCQKPWLPGLAAFAIPAAYDNWRGDQLTLATTPPYERLIYLSGQHPGPATQNPKLRTTDKPPPNDLPLDITEYVRQVVDEGRKTFSIGLKGFTPFSAAHEPHGLGHTMNFYAMGHEKSAVIVVELEK